MSKYSEKLKDIRWQKKRLKIFERDDWTCQECGETNGCLHIHHKEYTTSNPWDELNENLITLCELCHGRFKSDKIEYNIDKELNSIIDKMNKLLLELEVCSEDKFDEILEEFFTLDLKKQSRCRKLRIIM